MNEDLFLSENNQAQQTLSKSENELVIASDQSVKQSPEWTVKMIQKERAKDDGVKNLTKMTNYVSNRDEAQESPGAPANGNGKVPDAPVLSPNRRSKLGFSKSADSRLPSGFKYTQNKNKVSEKTPQETPGTPKVLQKPVVQAVTPTAVDKQGVVSMAQEASPKQPSETTPTGSRPRLSSADIDMTPTRAEKERVSMGVVADDDVYKESTDRPTQFLPLMPSPRKETPKQKRKGSVRAFNRPEEWLSNKNAQTTKYKFKRVVDSSEIENDDDSEEEDSLDGEISSTDKVEIEETTLLPATPNLNSSMASLLSVDEHEDEDEDAVQKELQEEIVPEDIPAKEPEVISPEPSLTEDPPPEKATIAAASAEKAPPKALTPLERLRLAQSTSRKAVEKAYPDQKDRTEEILADDTITGPPPKKESSRTDFYGSMSAIPFLVPKQKPIKTKSKRKTKSKGGNKDKKEGEASVSGDEIAVSTSGSFDAPIEEESQTKSEFAAEPDLTNQIMNEMANLKSVPDREASNNTSLLSEHSSVFDDEEMEAKKALWKSMSAMDDDATDRPLEFLPLRPTKRREKKVSASTLNAKSRAYNRPEEWLSPKQKVKVKQGWKAKKILDPNQINPEELPETSGDDSATDVPDKEGIQPSPVLD